MTDLKLPLSLAQGYSSPSQIARVVTENWVSSAVGCPACTRSVTKAPNNSPGLDFLCRACGLSFELKSKRGRFGAKLVDGAYDAMIRKIEAGTQSNFFLLSYSVQYEVTDLLLVPRRFIVASIVEKRKPLASYARRAGWIGCNLKISELPSEGKIFYVKDRSIVPGSKVFAQWKSSDFLEEMSTSHRGWLIAIMRCVEQLNKVEFNLADVYSFVPHLETMFPENGHVKAKIRQQLQVLRDKGWLRFHGNGRYARSLSI